MFEWELLLEGKLVTLSGDEKEVVLGFGLETD